MSKDRDHISTSTLAFDFNRNGGNVTNFQVNWEGRTIRPLHAAPWIHETSELPDSLDLVERQLEGDFFCAPFGNTGGRPIHGWTANGRWDRDASGGNEAATHSYQLEKAVSGASVKKHFTVITGHPFLYQCHEFTGGSGHLSVAHHAMVHVPGGARLSFSEKQFGVTPLEALETDPERGHSMLAYPQRFDNLGCVKDASGNIVDMRTYPFAQNHEDIVVLAEKQGASLGWSAALAPLDGFVFIAIKDAKRLPETLLWMSNGGRNYAPWSGRHEAVLGIEEAATGCHHTGQFGSATEPSPHGLPCGLNLSPGGTIEIRYVFGAIPVPPGWSRIADIRVAKSQLTLQDTGGESLNLPFDGHFFGL